MAPEIVRRQKFSLEKAQVWSLGIVLFLLMFGTLPFDNENEVLNLDILPRIIEKSIYYGRFQNEDNVIYLQRMLSKDPKMRPPLEEIQQHWNFHQNIYKPLE